VHCAALGAPIVGDRKYGGEAGQVEGLADRLHLHARGLVLPHPNGGTLSLEADLPAHMRETFKSIGFHAPKPSAPQLG
jgi:23S rRNA pseudouridine955/2504/2580 synthase